MHRRRIAVVVVAAILCTSLGPGLLAGGVTAGGPAGDDSTTERGSVAATSAPTVAQEIDADRTRIRIDLGGDGDARWTVELWTRLEDDADEEAFASLQADVRNDSDAYTADFRNRMNGSVTAASDATGREMAMRNVTVATRTEGVPRSYGVLAYEFEWTNFAAVEGNELHAGGAIDGFLLEQSTRLTIAWPDGYRSTTVEPQPDDRTDSAVVWRGGETDFVAGQPRLVATSAAPDDGSLLPIAAGVAVLAAVLALVGYLAWGEGRSLPGSGGRETDEQGAAADRGGAGAASAAAGTGAAASGDDSAEADDRRGDAQDRADGAPSAGGDVAAKQPADGTDDETGVDASTGTAGGADDGVDSAADGVTDDAADATGADTAAGATDDVPPELLSNEEQVLGLLEDNGGRMKQQQVVAELDWTEAKTSQVVTGMREADQIEVFRIGRENVLALPGEADL